MYGRKSVGVRIKGVKRNSKERERRRKARREEVKDILEKSLSV